VLLQSRTTGLPQSRRTAPSASLMVDSAQAWAAKPLASLMVDSAQALPQSRTPAPSASLMVECVQAGAARPLASLMVDSAQALPQSRRTAPSASLMVDSAQAWAGTKQAVAPTRCSRAEQRGQYLDRQAIPRSQPTARTWPRHYQSQVARGIEGSVWSSHGTDRIACKT